jgi:hypothetical protein
MNEEFDKNTGDKRTYPKGDILSSKDIFVEAESLVLRINLG